LILSSHPIRLRAVFAPAWGRFAFRAGIVLILVLLLRLTRSWLPACYFAGWDRRAGFSVAQATLLAGGTLLLASASHLTRAGGFLTAGRATETVRQAHAGNFLPKIGLRQVARLLHEQATFVDARLKSDYDAGHLAQAISVPVDANEAEQHRAVAGIPRNRQIVVYCQSARCQFAEKVAIALQTEGFSRVCVFRGGWNEWTMKNGT
jgi:rhodanese-related sulfurtransferase